MALNFFSACGTRLRVSVPVFRAVPGPVLVLSSLVAALGLGGCSVPRIVTEYRIDVQQGNVLTQEMVAQLKPGQTRDQVRFILGTPLLTDIFHADRWDYIYRMQNGRTNAVEERRLTVFFSKEGKLERLAGNVEAAPLGELTAPVPNSQVIDLATPVTPAAPVK